MSQPRAQYITLSYPFSGPPQEIARREAREGMRRLMEQKGARIDLIREFLRAQGGLSLDVTSDLKEFDALPKCLASLGGLRTRLESEIEAQVAQARPAIQHMMRQHLPKEEMDDQTSAVCFDAALLWGDCFIDKYPSASWTLGVGGKLFVDYQRPVIVGPALRGPVFNPERQLRGAVSSEIFKEQRQSPLSSVTELRAVSLGLVNQT